MKNPRHILHPMATQSEAPTMTLEVARQLNILMETHNYTISDILLGCAHITGAKSPQPRLMSINFDKLLRLARQEQLQPIMRWINGGEKPFYPKGHRLHYYTHEVVKYADRVWRKELQKVISTYLDGLPEEANKMALKLSAGGDLISLCEACVTAAEVTWVIKELGYTQCINSAWTQFDPRDCTAVMPETVVKESIMRYLPECRVKV